MQLAAQQPRGYRALQKRQQRKFARRASGEELRPIDTNTRIREALDIAVNDQVSLEAEVASRVMRWIGNEHNARVRPVLEREAAEINVRTRIAVDYEEGPWPEQRNRFEDAAAGLERHRSLIAVSDRHAVVTAVTQRGADAIRQP